MAVAAISDSLPGVLRPEFFQKLDRLRLVVRRAGESWPGNTPISGVSRATGIEIENHSVYAPGDDLRRVDWNVYGRSEELLVKRFRAECEAPLYVFLDISASMSQPVEDGKATFSTALAASLAYLSTRHGDPVRVIAVGGALPGGFLSSPLIRHRQLLHRIHDFLGQLQVRGETDLATGVSAALRRLGHPGVAILISDFLLQPSNVESALGELNARPCTCAALRVIGEVELDPGKAFRQGVVVDAESGEQRRVSWSERNRQRYAATLERHLGEMKELCNRRRTLFVAPDISRGLEDSLFRQLPAAGLLR